MAAEKRWTVVSIEDDVRFGELLDLILKREDVRVEQATDGEEGLRLAKELKPDLILLDLMMPEMDGWAVLAQLQKDEATSQIPVVVITAKSSESDREFGLNVAGVNAYLMKPVSARELRSAVAEALGLIPEDSGN